MDPRDASASKKAEILIPKNRVHLVWALLCSYGASKMNLNILLVFESRRGQIVKINIAKGTTDPRVEFYIPN